MIARKDSGKQIVILQNPLTGGRGYTYVPTPFCIQSMWVSSGVSEAEALYSSNQAIPPVSAPFQSDHSRGDRTHPAGDRELRSG